MNLEKVRFLATVAEEVESNRKLPRLTLEREISQCLTSFTGLGADGSEWLLYSLRMADIEISSKQAQAFLTHAKFKFRKESN